MSLTWRSPSMLPPPVDPASVTRPADPVARLAIGAAWRLRAFGHSLARGLHAVPGGEPGSAVVRRIERALAGSDAFVAHAALDPADAERLVQARLRGEPLPSSASWAEVAMADVLFGGALDRQIRALAASSEEGLARAAGVAEPAASFGIPLLEELSAHAPNRACLQILVDRWLASACQVFGRPGTATDAKLASSGVRPAAAAALGGYLGDVEATLWGLGLQATDAQFMGIVVPDGWEPRRRPQPQR